MTAEGDYCPEHGLAECYMEEGFLGKLFGTEKKKKAAGELRPYMIYDKFTIYVDPVDGEWVVAGTGEYQNKFEPKATPMYGQTGDPNLLVMYAMKHTGGGFGIRDPLKVNKEALRGVQEDGGAVGMPYSMGEGVVGNMFNKAKSMFTKPAALAPQAAPAAPAPVVPAAAAAAPGAVKKGGTMDMTKKVAAPATKPAAAPAAPTAGKVQGIKSNVDVNTLQKFNGIVDVSPKIKPQIKDAGGVTWTKTNMGWTDGKRSIDPKDSTYQSFDDAWRVANGAQPGNVGVPGAQQPAVAEGNNDPINSNSAMTGSYYEGKETRTQEGDALLARIKSLALLR
jgi:hypothetical protein